METPRLLLRPLRADDAAAFLAYRSDPAVARYQGWAPRSLADAQAFIARAGGVSWGPGWRPQHGIVLRGSEVLIGDTGFRVADDPRIGEVGISLAPAYQGRGFAAEALRAVLDEAFAARGIHRVTASIDPRNAPSLALFERLGFRREAHHRESLWLNGRWVDDVVVAILEREWRRGHGVPSPPA